jgi:hypothetical protein
MVDRVTLIQCTGSKRDRPAAAWMLYDESRYFRRQREWAVARGNPWFILSAKYGLLEPSALIDTYDAVGLSEQQANEIADTLAEMGVSTADIQAGRKYTNPLVPELESRGIDVVEHFAGCKIGTREKRLAEATTRLIHHSL